MSVVVDLVEGVFDLVGDVVEWAVDEIIQPVVKTVGNVIEGMLDNPIKTIAQVAAIATGQYWALPLIEGADVAAKGGDIGDVLEATAKAYIGQQIGAAAGKYAYQGASTAAAGAAYGTSGQQAAMLAAQEAGMGTFADIAGQVVGAGAASAATGLVYGRDPIQAFTSGLVSAGTSQLVGMTLGTIDQQTGGVFAKLQKDSPTAAAVIESAISAQLTGQNVTGAVISSAINASKIAVNLVDQFTKDNPNITAAQKSIAAKIITDVTATAFAGGNPNAALQATLMKVGSKALGDILTKGFKNSIASVETAYNKSANKADEIDKNIAAQQTAADKYNGVVNTLNARVKEQDRLLTVANNAKAAFNQNPNDATAKAANDAITAYNNYAAQLTKDYDSKFKPDLDKFQKELTTLQTGYDKLVTEYNDAQQDIAKKITPLETSINKLYSQTAEAFVTVMDPGFKVSEYKEINGLKNLSDEDAYEHWLNEGQFKGLKTNVSSAKPEIAIEQNRLLTDLAKAKGVSVSQLSSKDISDFQSQINNKYGNNVDALKKANLTDFITGNVKSVNDLVKDSTSKGFKIDVNGVSYGDWAKPPSGTFDLPSNMRYATSSDVEKGTATKLNSNTGAPVWVVPEQTTRWDPASGTQTIAPIIVTATRLDDLQRDDPLSWFYTASSLPEAAARKSVGDYLYGFAKNTMELAKKTGSSTLINTAGNVLKAGGGILSSFNGLVVLANKNPNNTAVGKFADKLVKLGEATTTKEYQDAVADMQKIMGTGTGIIGTAKAIWGAAKAHPIEFMAEIIGVEGMQEIVPLLIGGGAAKVAQGLALARGMGTQIANRIGTRTGLAAAGVSDIAESAGGSAASAFNDAYDTARKAGKNEAEATKIALDIAAKTALVAGTVTAVSLGIGGAALEKAILGKNATGELGNIFTEIGNRIKDGGTIVVKEGVTEGIEEGLVQAFVEGQLYQLDPSRDVTGNIASSVILGAIAGGGVAGGAFAGYTTGNAISNVLRSNPTISNIIETSSSARDLNTKLTNLGITDNVVKTNLLNVKYDSDYTSSAEARNALLSRPDFLPSDADINALVGATKNVDLAKAVEAYVDPRVLDREEIIAAARAEGVTLTEAQIANYIGQKDEAQAIAAARKELDPLGTTYDEARAIFRDVYGYTPTADEINRFVNIREVTSADALAYLRATGDQAGANVILEAAVRRRPVQDALDLMLKANVTPSSTATINLSEDQAKKDIGAYVDPRQVTYSEAEKYFADLGYKPTDAEIRRFVGQVNQETQFTSIGEYVDPRLVTADEVAAAYAALGLKKPTEEDIQKLVGQYAESDLPGKAKDYLPTAQYNSIINQLDSLRVGANQETLDAIDIVKRDVTNSIADLGLEVAKVDKSVNDAKAELKTALADVASGNATRFDSVDKAIADLKAAGLTEDQVNNIVSEIVGTPASDASEATGLYKELSDLGVDVAGITSAVGSPASDTSEATGLYKRIGDIEASLSAEIKNTETAILNKMADYEAAGIARDEALQRAIDDVASELGTTRNDLLTRIGKTEETLKKDLGVVREELGTALSEVQANVIQRMSEYEAAGITRDEALQRAIDDVGAQLSDTEINILNRMSEYEAAGITRDEALQRAISDSQAAIETKLGETETRLSQDIQAVADFVGKPARDVTQADIDFVNDIIALQQTQPDTQLTPQQLAYDVNQDNKIDQADIDILQNIIRGTVEQPFIPPPGSPWAPTGIYGVLSEQDRLARERDAAARAQAAQLARETQQRGNVNMLQQMLMGAPDIAGQQVTVKSPDPAKIGYVYDIAGPSIFATPQQAQMFVTPYAPFAEGGMVEDDVTTELLKILRS